MVSTKSVIIVDDSPYIIKSLEKILSKNGCEVIGRASNGLEAIKLYKELTPDFVTLDLVMPQMGGIQTLQLLKRIDPKAKVIMVSSMSDKEKIVECVKLGAKHYILKPFDEKTVLEVITQVVFNS
jgi:two-component system chemotaxis response regulator CheY